MSRADIIMVVAGLAVVLIIGVAVQQPSFSLPWSGETGPGAEGMHEGHEQIRLAPFEAREPAFSYPVFTIQLVENPFGYPRVYMPGTASYQSRTYQIIDGERYEVFPLFGKAPHLTLRHEGITSIEWIPVGILQQKRGGISTPFRIPQTPYWRISVDVAADRNPGQALFRYVLCDAENGAILDGGEVMGRGSLRSLVIPSEKEMYFIISATSVDAYTITLEVPREYL